MMLERGLSSGQTLGVRASRFIQLSQKSMKKAKGKQQVLKPTPVKGGVQKKHKPLPPMLQNSQIDNMQDLQNQLEYQAKAMSSSIESNYKKAIATINENTVMLGKTVEDDFNTVVNTIKEADNLVRAMKEEHEENMNQVNEKSQLLSKTSKKSETILHKEIEEVNKCIKDQLENLQSKYSIK
eukprot:TRINITY_DN1705_c0_g1_i3.p1 TRINITY_DN1705_c0_g1~~TRINITY_DN1705_c0_g1_i3.p1  ORF type:complete len:182 (-),score=28.66 TRINITY_DN1705_c0_g1_i3:400-945(-)